MLQGVLPKIYARGNLDSFNLGKLIDEFSNIDMKEAKGRSADILGHVFDPCCGTGGMFVQSEEFVKEHQGRINDISIFGQESNQTTWRLAKMNLAIRGIDSSQVKWNNKGSFLENAHKDLKADYIIANPPFNDKKWNGHLLKKDGRWLISMLKELGVENIVQLENHEVDPQQKYTWPPMRMEIRSILKSLRVKFTIQKPLRQLLNK